MPIFKKFIGWVKEVMSRLPYVFSDPSSANFLQFHVGKITAVSAVGSFSLDENATVYWAVFDNLSFNPNDILSGSGAIFSGSVNVAANAFTEVSLSPLASYKAHWFAAVSQNIEGVISSEKVKGFTTKKTVGGGNEPTRIYSNAYSDAYQ